MVQKEQLNLISLKIALFRDKIGPPRGRLNVIYGIINLGRIFPLQKITFD